MTKNPRTYNLEELLAGYVLGDLDEAELVWLNQQLAVNPELRKRVVELETTLTLMPYGLPDDRPQNDLRSQILVQAQVKSQGIFQLNRWGWIFGAITALSTLWLGTNNFSLRQQLAFRETESPPPQELITLLRQPNNRLVTFQGLNEVPKASGSLFIAPESNKAVLALQNLESLSGKQVYRLWAISQNKKTGCANFIPNAEGIVHLELSSTDALSDANSVLITIEPEADTDQPLGSEFLTGAYSAI